MTHVEEDLLIKPERSALARRTLAITAAAVLATAVSTGSSLAQSSGSSLSYDHDIHLTYEFDDNVREDLLDPVQAQVGKIAYEGDLQWAGGDQRLSFSYAGGFKRHFDVDELTGVAASDGVSNQFVHQGSLEYLRRLSRNVFVSGRGAAKTRRWTDDEQFFINEDTYTLYSGEIAAIVDLQPLQPEESVQLQVGARYSDIEFKNLDRFFGTWTVGGDLALTKRFNSELEARATYSFDRVRYPGRGVLEPGDPAQDIIGFTRPRQEDRIHEVGAEVEWFGPIGILAEYRYRDNDSNSFGFDNFSHSVGIQILRQLPWNMLVQAYGQVELRTYTEPPPRGEGLGRLDVGEPEDNVLLLRLVKDISEAYSVEARYVRYRNESITLDDFYTKNIWSIGFTIRP